MLIGWDAGVEQRVMLTKLGESELRADICLKTEGASDLSPKERLGFEYGGVCVKQSVGRQGSSVSGIRREGLVPGERAGKV